MSDKKKLESSTDDDHGVAKTIGCNEDEEVSKVGEISKDKFLDKLGLVAISKQEKEAIPSTSTCAVIDFIVPNFNRSIVNNDVQQQPPFKRTRYNELLLMSDDNDDDDDFATFECPVIPGQNNRIDEMEKFFRKRFTDIAMRETAVEERNSSHPSCSSNPDNVVEADKTTGLDNLPPIKEPSPHQQQEQHESDEMSLSPQESFSFNNLQAIRASTAVAVPSSDLVKPVYIFGGKEYVALADFPHLRCSENQHHSSTTPTASIQHHFSIRPAVSHEDYASFRIPARRNPHPDIISRRPISPDYNIHHPLPTAADRSRSPSSMASSVIASALASLNSIARNNSEPWTLPRADTPDHRQVSRARRLIELEDTELLGSPPHHRNNNNNNNSDGAVEDDAVAADATEEEFSELEVASDSDLPENPIENFDSTTDSPTVDVQTAAATQDEDDVESESGVHVFGRNGFYIRTTDSDGNDSSNNDTTIETNSKFHSSKLTPKKHPCAQCDASVLSIFIYCLRCFRIRRNWLPKRPRARRLKKRKQQMNRRIDVDSLMMTTTSSTTRRGDPCLGQVQSPRIILDRVDDPHHHRFLPSDRNIDLNTAFLVSEDNPGLDRLHPITPPGSITICELLTPPSSEAMGEDERSELKCILGLDLDQPHTSESHPTSSGVDQQGSKPDKKTCSSIDSSDTCYICFTRRKNSAFVHNKIAHFCCCYTCGDKILKRDGKCPICRERVLRLVKVLDV
ncbi:uncharacterized protein LOC110853723 [Folsomia candida]|nr:uncharacterized protein LOC110853723 [Folsomia candida]XP_021957730.1 uncharacterized protein LOC110853723 [Folsomia candida]